MVRATRLKKEDKQILERGGNYAVGQPGYDWPPFLSGQAGVHDYVECHIYDESGESLIESFITTDYEIKNNQVVTKPGNDLRSKGKKVIGKMENFKKMYGNYRNYDKKYRVWLSNINGIWNENKKRILVCKGEDHPFNKICKMEDEYGYEEDKELFRELYNWKKFVKYDRV